MRDEYKIVVKGVLPVKLSDCFRLAIQDVKNSTVTYQPHEWFFKDKKRKVCGMCLAGHLMYPRGHTRAEDYLFGPVAHKAKALDALRCGNIFRSLLRFYSPTCDKNYNVLKNLLNYLENHISFDFYEELMLEYEGVTRRTAKPSKRELEKHLYLLENEILPVVEYIENRFLEEAEA